MIQSHLRVFVRGLLAAFPFILLVSAVACGQAADPDWAVTMETPGYKVILEHSGTGGTVTSYQPGTTTSIAGGIAQMTLSETGTDPQGLGTLFFYWIDFPTSTGTVTGFALTETSKKYGEVVAIRWLPTPQEQPWRFNFIQLIHSKGKAKGKEFKVFQNWELDVEPSLDTPVYFPQKNIDDTNSQLGRVLFDTPGFKSVGNQSSPDGAVLELEFTTWVFADKDLVPTGGGGGATVQRRLPGQVNWGFSSTFIKNPPSATVTITTGPTWFAYPGAKHTFQKYKMRTYWWVDPITGNHTWWPN